MESIEYDLLNLNGSRLIYSNKKRFSEMIEPTKLENRNQFVEDVEKKTFISDLL